MTEKLTPEMQAKAVDKSNALVLKFFKVIYKKPQPAIVIIMACGDLMVRIAKYISMDKESLISLINHLYDSTEQPPKMKGILQ